MSLKYKIYRCYEIVILDEHDNQIGDSDYVYTDRKDAKACAEHRLQIEESRMYDSFPGPKFEVGCRYASEMLATIEITKRKGGWVWFKPVGTDQEFRRKIYHWAGECEMINSRADSKAGFDWLAINKEEGC